jgi:tRNA-dihydrouridine synthase B
MAGVTNTVFRRICKKRGADVVTTEFVSAEGILHRNKRTKHYLEFHEEERPLGVQLFGAEPDRLAAAAQEVIEWVRPDFIDLNFGCPVNKVVCKNGGSSLLKNCPLLERIAAAVVRAAHPLPVTAKIRIGWDHHSINAVKTARILEQTGIRRVTVHGRTKEQGYSGRADWKVIGEVAAAIAIPVIGNGDIASAADALARRRDTGVSGMMIGRAAMSSPWLFSEIRSAMNPSFPFSPPTLEEKWRLICDHCSQEIQSRGNERNAVSAMRSRFMAYTRAMPGGSRLREGLARVKSLSELEDIAAFHLGFVAAQTPFYHEVHCGVLRASRPGCAV